jgi:hypothetical protein
MVGSVVEKLPSLEEVEQEISRAAREARLLRSLREILKRQRDRERASEQLRKGARHVSR